MTSDRDALFAAVRAAPDDDLPRLVFADWLDEQGHPALAARAAFIRLQVEAEGHPVGSAVRLELVRQAGELRPRFRDEWDDEFSPSELAGTTVVRRRGFVDEVQTGVGRFAAIGPRMFLAAPVRAVWLTGETAGRGLYDVWEDATEFPFLAGVRELRVGPHLSAVLAGEPFAAVGERFSGRPALDFLLDSPHLTGVRRLALANNDLEDPWLVGFVARLPDAPVFAGLRELDLSHNPFADPGAFALAAARGLDRLDRLALTGSRFTPAGVAALRLRFGDRVVL